MSSHLKHHLGLPGEDPRPAVQDHRLHREGQARQPEGDTGRRTAADLAAATAGDTLRLVNSAQTINAKDFPYSSKDMVPA